MTGWPECALLGSRSRREGVAVRAVQPGELSRDWHVSNGRAYLCASLLLLLLPCLLRPQIFFFSQTPTFGLTFFPVSGRPYLSPSGLELPRQCLTVPGMMGDASKFLPAAGTDDHESDKQGNDQQGPAHALDREGGGGACIGCERFFKRTLLQLSGHTSWHFAY